MDKLILIDLFDNEIGYGEKLDVHKKGLLHRAFSIFIYHENKMLIHKRAYDKYHSGGLWTNACCSHPRQGENMITSVQKRLGLELNIPEYTCCPEEIFNFVYFQKYSDNLFEYEFDHVFIVDYSGSFNANPDEIAETRWVTFVELEEELRKNPGNFTTWFLIAAPKVLAHIK